MFNPEGQKLGAPKGPEQQITKEALNEGYSALVKKAELNPAALREARMAEQLHKKTAELLPLLRKKSTSETQASSASVYEDKTDAQIMRM